MEQSLSENQIFAECDTIDNQTMTNPKEDSAKYNNNIQDPDSSMAFDRFRDRLGPQLPLINQTYLDGIRCGKLLFYTMVVAISAFQVGYFEAFASVCLVQTDNSCKTTQHGIEMFSSHYSLSSIQTTMINGCVCAGAMISTFILVIFAIVDCLGRRNLIIIGNLIIILSIAAALLIFPHADSKTSNLIGILIGLFGIGFGIGIQTICAPILISEYCPRYYRALMVGIFALFIGFGRIACVLCHELLSWQVMFAIGLAPAAIQFSLALCVLPGSPRWLLIRRFKNDYYQKRFLQSGENTFSSFWGFERADQMKIANDEFTQIGKLVNNNLINFRGNKFWQNNISNLLVLGICLNIFQQFCGFNFVTNQISSIVCYEHESKAFAVYCPLSLILYTLLIAVNICVLLSIQRCEYKKFIANGTVIMLMGIIMIIILELYTGRSNIYLLIPLSMYIIGYGLSFGPFTWIISTELFPIAVKGKYFSLCVFTQWSSNFIISSNILSYGVSKMIHDNVNNHVWVLFILFGVLILIYFVIVSKRLPNKNHRIGDIASKNAVLLENAPYLYSRTYSFFEN